MREVLRSDDDPTPRERLDDPPDAASRAGVAIVLATVVLFSLLAVVAGGFVDLPLAGLALLAMLCMLAVAAGSPAARHVSLLCLFTAAAYRMRGFGPHPFPLVSALVGYGVVVMITPTLRGSVHWLGSGSFEPPVRRLVAAVTLASLVALPTWCLLSTGCLPGHHNPFGDVPVWALPAVGLGFAAVKAAAEEAAFRGVVMDALRGCVGQAAAIVLQATMFGLVHYAHGLPGGVGGGILRRRLRARARDHPRAVPGVAGPLRRSLAHESHPVRAGRGRELASRTPSSRI